MARKLEKRICVICGEEFQPKRGKQLCCSGECARKKMGMTNRKPIVCKYCGNEFWKPDAIKNNIHYCSEECKNKAFEAAHPRKEKAQRQMEHKICAWCGTAFTTMSKINYCSRTCAYNAFKKAQREKWKEQYVPRTFMCKWCGRMVITACGDTHSVFCCEDCSNAYQHKQEHSTARHKACRKRQKILRERMIKAVFVEDVYYDDIYKKSAGICAICGLPVPSEKHEHGTWDGTIDHIVPVSCGGEHSVSNCQLAHRICNSLKCQSDGGYHIDWQKKASESSHWRKQYDNYLQIMQE